MKTESLPLVKAIRACGNMSPQKKNAVIKKIDRINRSRAEKKRCRFKGDRENIFYAFWWDGTKEKYNYWRHVYAIMEGIR